MIGQKRVKKYEAIRANTHLLIELMIMQSCLDSFIGGTPFNVGIFTHVLQLTYT